MKGSENMIHQTATEARQKAPARTSEPARKHENPLEYWKHELEGAPELMQLPLDFQRQGVHRYEEGSLEFSIAGTLRDEIVRMTESSSGDIASALLTSFAVLLSRYSLQDDIVIGMADPHFREADPTQSVEILPVRFAFNSGTSFSEAVKSTRDKIVSAFEYHRIPFSFLTGEKQQNGRAVHHPVFQAAFSFEDLSGSIAMPGPLAKSIVPVDLVLRVTDRNSRIDAEILYNTFLFRRDSIERMAGHLMTILNAVAISPDLAVATIPLLTGEEEQVLFTEWNSTQVNYPKEKCVHHIFEEWVVRTPDAIAVADDHTELSYAELNERANRLAHWLISKGAGEGIVITLFLERSVNIMVALLAISKSGATYLPLDPIYPKARLRLILEDAKPALCVTESSVAGKLPETDSVMIYMDDDAEYRNAPAENPGLGNPLMPAYILYTSGSTGKPKGVPVKQHSLVNLVNSFTNMIGVSPDDIYLNVATIAFDIAELDMYLPLFNGARVVIASQETVMNMDLLAERFETSGATLFQATPVTYKMLLLNNWKGKSDLKVITGGDALTKDQGRALIRICKEVWNCYGPTETTIYSTGKLVVPEDLEGEGIVSIGKPLDNNFMYILSPGLVPVPIGVPGELFIGGDSVSPGYINLPELTAEKFLPDPYSSEPGATMYKSGDLVKYLPDGNMIFLNRIDSQVKIRGFRIELGEIETVLSAFSGIREVAVLVRKDQAGDNMLVAYFTSRAESTVSLGDLRQYLRERLPEYMVPSVFVPMEKFPLTANNKVDRKALPDPSALTPTPAEGTATAATETERKLVKIWSSIPGLGAGGVNDNFFELGGHSLSVAQMIVKVRAEFNTDLPFRTVYEQPTIAEIAKFIDRSRAVQPEDSGKTDPIPHIPEGETVPLSSAQSRIWFMEQMEGTDAAYNIPVDYLVTGELDPALLSESLRILVARHDSLRTVFPVIDGHPFQRVLPEVDTILHTITPNYGITEDREALMAKHSLGNALFRFDLEKGPLFRFSLVDLGDGSQLFLLNFHHIVSDAVSIGVFMEELTMIYTALRDGREIRLPEIAHSYAGYAAWQNRWLSRNAAAPQLDYWKKELAGAPPVLQLPTDRPRPKAQTYHGSEFHFSLSRETRDRITDLGISQGGGRFLPMLTAFGLLLSRHAAQDDLVIGVPFANRTRDEAERMSGVFINNIPLRFTIDGAKSFAETASATREKFLAAYENQAVPFERLVDELRVKRSLNTSPVFQVLFNYLTVFRNEIDFHGFKLDLLDGERRTARYDLTLTVNEQDESLDCVFEYNTDLFDAGTIERLAGHYSTILDSVTGDPEIRTGKIPLLTEAESQLILRDRNRTETGYPSDRCIHRMFEEQVLRTPDSIAVEAEGVRLTYSGLNARANGIAHRLSGLGAGPGTIVAVCLERGADLIAALLAVSKTGAAYLPLDPIYPKARLGMILDDADPVLMLSQDSLADKLPDHPAPVIFLRGDEGSTSEENMSAGNPDQTAYILYTSGSTGKPKGVQILHHSVVNLVNAMRKRLRVSASDTLLAVTTISFDIAQLELFLPLFTGGRLVIATAETQMDPALLKAKLETSGATIFQATPVTFRMLALHGWEGKKDLKVVCGGEAMSRELASRLISGCAEVWNVYGPTETTIWSTVRKVTEADTIGEGYVPIGKPLDNTTVYVLNPDLVPVPDGIPGELFIGGAGVSPGYLNLPGMNQERFLPDPFDGYGQNRIYRTGDLVKSDPDGTLHFMNRIDSQVKIRGFRIELGEVESALSQVRDIAENVVVVRDDPSGGNMLVGYYTSRSGEAIPDQEIRQVMREHLPEYMVPSAFVRMASFPLTANNKIDRKALPDPVLTDTGNTGPDAGITTPTEERLAAIWKSVLKLDRAGADEDFFESGGHSMIAVTLMLRIEKEFGIRLPLATLFEHSTIRGLGGILDSRQEAPDRWRSLVPIRPKGSKKPLFLVHGLGLNVLLYTTITNHLDPEQPVYGLQAKGLNGTEPPLKTIEEIAAHYISEIRTVDPEGPYSLAGFSLGGKIAFEMSRQLAEAGKTVCFLGLLDATADISPAGMPPVSRFLTKVNYGLRYIGWNIAGLFNDPDESLVKVFRRRMRGLKKKILGLDFHPNQMGPVSEGKERELPIFLRRMHRANRRASKRYIIRPYNGQVHLFRAAKQTFYIPDPVRYGWDKYVKGGVVIHTIPGEHSTTFAPPNDKKFAEILQQCLNESHEHH